MLVWTSGQAFCRHMGGVSVHSPFRGADFVFWEALSPFRGAGAQV